MKRVFVTRPIPESGLRLLRSKKVRVDVFPKDRPIRQRELRRALKRVAYDGIVTILTDAVDEKFFQAAGPSLKVVANYAVGYDNIDLKAAARHKVMVTNTPGPEISEAVAEHTLALLFALLRRVVEADEYLRRGKYKAWGPKLLLGTDLIGKTVGIVGMGRIGEALARRVYDGFGVKILYTNESGNRTAEEKYLAKRVSLDALLKRADIVSLHVPLTKETRHLIGKRELRAMKPSAFLINTSRGPVVDEAALIEVLEGNVIAGAALDVFEHEPKIPRALRQLQNVVLTPHTASATVKVRETMSRRAAENLLAVFAGKTPPNSI